MRGRLRRRVPPLAVPGFTLLEILVALVVFGFLMTGLTSGIRFGLRAWSAQVRTLDTQSDVEAVDGALRRLIERMAPAGAGEAAIQGESGRLAFTSDLPMAMPAGARLADMALGLDGRGRLVLRWVPHRPAVRLGPAPAMRETKLLDGVSRLELAYWPRRGPGGWQPAWRNRQLPALVRLRIVFANDKRHWPDIVVAPMRDSFDG